LIFHGGKSPNPPHKISLIQCIIQINTR